MPPSSASALAIEGLGRAVAPLEGPWQFHLGDDPNWASPTFDDSHWERLTAEKPWGEQGHPSYTGYAWYRLHLSLNSVPGDQTNFALLVPHLDDVYEIFWNGNSIGRSGKFPPYPIWYRSTDAPVLYPLNPGTPESRPEHERQLSGTLAIRVWKAPLTSEDSGQSGGFEGSPVIGYPESVAAYKTTLDYQWLRANQFSFGQYLLYGIAGLLALFSWLRDREQKALLWMTGFALTPLLRLVLYGMRIAWPVGLSNALGPPISSIRDISLWFLLLWLLHLDDNPSLIRLIRRFAIVSLAASTSDGLLSLLDASVSWYWLIQITDAILTAIYFITAAVPLALVALAIKQHRHLDLARRLLVIAAFLWGMIQVVQGLAPQGQRFTHWTLADKLHAPLFHLYGNAVSAPTLAGIFLLVALLYAVYRTSMDDRRRRSLLEQEMSSARELQHVLIPETFPSIPGFAVTSAYRPALEVGGDFFQIIPLDDDFTLVILGDVSGKGLKAAIAVSLIVGLVRVLVENTHSPAQLLTELNRRLSGRLHGGFATCVALRLDPHGNCVLASAGHPPPYLNDQEVVIHGSFPLGLFPTIAYEESYLHLQVNDHLALYTDGLLEARSKTGELYGFDRTRELFAALPNAARAAEAAVHFGQDDDITIVTLVRVPAGNASTDLTAADRNL
ncbi:PP2C family protein-serine/threonine phosphatase [Tunturibacter empetritectus]|uniref:PP2C family protein-serine/threonine phosphatase n=1 Tax=Tunturiibacter empetritectus TaxID=3069691 RepID=UPI0016167D56|nr:PP2C family protein-serine/threonine phosphatase [Edaphobacter lichenicola]